MLEIFNLTKKYNEKVAVDNLSLTVPDGTICAFIGPNGAGKTTTLKSIAGIIDFEGQILIDKIDVSLHPMEAKKILAYVPDNPDLYEHLKGIGYLNFICDVFGIEKAERKARIEVYAKRLGIYDDLSSSISSYSHGMKQKLALVSALIHNPKLLLLDEPFVGLDPVCSHEFKLIMRELADSKVTIFYSTHVLDVAEKICDNVAIIKEGKLVAYDTMQNITKNEGLEQVFLEMASESEDKTDESRN